MSTVSEVEHAISSHDFVVAVQHKHHNEIFKHEFFECEALEKPKLAHAFALQLSNRRIQPEGLLGPCTELITLKSEGRRLYSAYIRGLSSCGETMLSKTYIGRRVIPSFRSSVSTAELCDW